MQEWLDNNDILKSIIAERFIKTFKAKIYKKMTANDSKSYLSYLNKLVDHTITLIFLLVKNLLMLIILF